MDGTEVAIRAVRRVGPDAIALDLETPPDFAAQPGQFVQLSARVDDEEITRHYTLSSPDVGETFEVTIGVDPEGTLSPWLAEADPGTTVEVAGPFGRSFYEGEDAVLILAGGPGVGPAVGIGERVMADGGNVAVVYCNDHPVHEDRLAGLSAGGATVVIVSGGPDGVVGTAFDEAVATALDDVNGQVFVYGFADFLDDAIAAVEAAGGDPDDAKTENFG
jgi:3-phenylpropionate/trans-cinnamate dioxygenase ferredoxin reductase subunit